MKELTEGMALPAYLSTQSADQVHRIIDRVGLEDSQELVRCLSGEQLDRVLAVDLWRAPVRGADEELDIGRLCVWIDVWSQEGEAYLYERLTGLDEDYLVLLFSELTVVRSITDQVVDQPGMVFADFLLQPVAQHEWGRVVDAASALWRYGADTLARILGNAVSETDDDAVGNRKADARYERQRSREKQGYIDASDAGAFLAGIKNESGLYWLESTAYCAISRRYFASLAGVDDTAQWNASDHADLPLTDQPEIDAAERARLDALLVESGLKKAASRRLMLAGPSGSEGDRNLVRQALSTLYRHQPKTIPVRMAELGFLSNVLIAGTEIQAGTFSERGAGRAVTALIELGLSLAMAYEECQPCDDFFLEWSGTAAGLLRPFRVGYFELARIPGLTVDAIYAAKDIQSRRRGHVAFLQMAEILGDDNLRQTISESRYADAKLMVEELTSAVDAAACVVLSTLLDPFPCFPRVLEPGSSHERMYVSRRYRFIDSAEDVSAIRTFLQRLPDHCGT